MSILVWVMLALLIVGFIGIWAMRNGRTVFDVAVFIILLFLLIGQIVP